MKLQRRSERQTNPRRQFMGRLVAGLSAVMLAGCDKLSHTEWFAKVLGSAETLNNGAQHLLTSRKSMAQEFEEKDLSPYFRSNGTSKPN